MLAHAAISTSGDAEQYIEIGGRRYSHAAADEAMSHRFTELVTFRGTGGGLNSLVGPRVGRCDLISGERV